MAGPKPLIAGNWKMNGRLADATRLAGAVSAFVRALPATAADVLVCPPYPFLAPVAQTLAGSRVRLGAQDCHAEAAGAFTGDVSAILCVGETLADRDEGRTIPVVAAQLVGSLPANANADNLVVAYEPVWAIGTGRTPTAAQVGEVHGAIRAGLSKRFSDGAKMRILYGGSVNGLNAPELLAIANVDGALAGGASLRADAFEAIVKAAPRR